MHKGLQRESYSKKQKHIFFAFVVLLRLLRGT